MKQVLKYLIVGLAALLLFTSCSGGGAGGSEDYIVAAEYAILPSGSHTAIATILTSSFSFITNADVYVNSVQLPYSFLLYGDSDFLSPPPTPGDTINFDISLNGSTLIDDSLTIPAGGAPASLSNTGTNVSSPITISWTAVSPSPGNIRVSISSFDTVSDDGYDVELSGSTDSHAIPANTILHDSMSPDVTITVSSMNSKIMGGTNVIVTEVQSSIVITTTN